MNTTESAAVEAAFFVSRPYSGKKASDHHLFTESQLEPGAGWSLTSSEP
jgi:hypothetical protein